LALLFLGIASASANAALFACPTQPAPTVDIQFEAEKLKYDYTKNAAQLKAMGSDTINPYEADVVTIVGGKMKGEMGLKASVDIAGLGNKINTCLWIKKVTIKITAKDTVYIASEYPKGTCQFGVNLEHEHKHVAIEHQTAQEHIGKIRDAAQSAAAKVGIVGPKPFGDFDMYAQKIRDYVLGEIKKEFQYAQMDDKKRQQALDSKAEYDRGSTACRNQK